MANMDLGSATLYRILIPSGQSEARGQRRASPRWAKQFALLHGYGVADMACMAVDINEQGLAFASRVPYRIGSAVQLDIELPAGSIRVEGQVKHCKNGIIGVEFVGLSKANRDALLAFCFADGPNDAAQGTAN
jgi:hypothetical protein